MKHKSHPCIHGTSLHLLLGAVVIILSVFSTALLVYFSATGDAAYSSSGYCERATSSSCENVSCSSHSSATLCNADSCCHFVTNREHTRKDYKMQTKDASIWNFHVW